MTNRQRITVGLALVATLVSSFAKPLAARGAEPQCGDWKFIYYYSECPSDPVGDCRFAFPNCWIRNALCYGEGWYEVACDTEPW